MCIQSNRLPKELKKVSNAIPIVTKMIKDDVDQWAGSLCRHIKKFDQESYLNPSKWRTFPLLPEWKFRKNLRFLQARGAVGFSFSHASDAIESNCPSGSKTSRILTKFSCRKKLGTVGSGKPQRDAWPADSGSNPTLRPPWMYVRWKCHYP